MLGVSLVEVEVRSITGPEEILPLDDANGSPYVNADNSQNMHTTTNTSPDVDAGNSQNTNTTTEQILHRVPDDKVVAEILASLKMLIKTYSFLPRHLIVRESLKMMMMHQLWMKSQPIERQEIKQIRCFGVN